MGVFSLQIMNKTGASISYGGQSFSNGTYVPLKHIGKYKVTDNKLWGADSGRSMTGSNKGTLIGIFPKINVQLIAHSEADMSAINKLTSQAAANCRYYDSVSQTVKTNSFYFGDVAWEITDANGMKFGDVEFSIIANEARR